MSNQIKPLLGILHPRKMPRVLKALDTITIDKFYSENMKQIEAYTRIRNFFLEHKEYTHLFLMSDDGEIFEENVQKLIKRVEENPDKPVIAGICNVDMGEKIDELAACIEYVDPIWEKRVYNHVKRGQLKGLHKTLWNGFALMSIERNVVEKIRFENDAELNKHNFGQSYDVMFSHNCLNNNIEIWTDFDNYFWHLKEDEGAKTFNVGIRPARSLWVHDGKTEVLYERPADNFKLIVSVVVYNEEESIEDLLYSLQRIEDLDAVYVLDGRFLDDEEDEPPRPSTDSTKEIFCKSRIGLFEKYWLGAQSWKSQSHKRNWLWNFIEKRENCDCWILSIDGDEEIVLPKNRRSIKLKPILKKVKEDIVILESGPHGENLNYPLEFFQIRLFRSNKGIHWYTGDVMVTHDKNCDIIMDHGRGLLCKPYSWIKNLMIFNKWMLRDKKKIRRVMEYRRNRILPGGECEYRRSKNLVSKKD